MFYDVIGPPWLLKSGANDNPQWNGPFVNGHLIDGVVGKKPGFYTYKLMVSKVKGFSSVETIDHGEGKGVYKYIVNNKPVIVVWDNNGATIDLSKYFDSKNVRITHIITELGETEPKIETKPANSISINETPVFVEEK